MAKEPIIYNPEQPMAHYQKAGIRYKKVKSTLDFGTVIPLISLVCGIMSILYSPREMALFALFGISFTMLSIIGCMSRRGILCLLSVPLAVVAGIAALAARDFFSPLGFAAHLAAALAEMLAIPAIDEFYKLKALPGFPFFKQSLDDISFAAKDHIGSAEFIDSEDFNKAEKTVYRINPDDIVKSSDMGNIVTGVSLEKKSAPEEPVLPDEVSVIEEMPKPKPKPQPQPQPQSHPQPQPPIKKKENESTYETMMRIQTNNNNEISDIDLFDM